MHQMDAALIEAMEMQMAEAPKVKWVAVNAIIAGRVQGVGYRSWVMHQAQQRGIHGWVRNRSDKTVEALFCGPSDVIDELVQKCWDGPMASRVTEIELSFSEESVETGFTRRETL